MEVYLEMFLSKWHLIVILLTAIAFFSLIIGGYTKKTVIKTTLKSFLFFYVMATIIITATTYDMKRMESEMVNWMDETYKDNKGIVNDHLVAFVGSFDDGDGNITVKVYAGNYHHSKPFNGEVYVMIWDEVDEVINEKTYKGIVLEPGEKVEIDSYQTKVEPDKFNYYFQS